MIKYRPGELDQRITFQSKQRLSDGMGGAAESWVDIDTTPTVWAHTRPKTGKESFEADRIEASAYMVFVIRNRSDLLESMRIVWDDIPYNIRSINQSKKRAMYLEIEAERGVAQ